MTKRRVGLSIFAAVMAIGLAGCETAPQSNLVLTPIASPAVTETRFSFLPVSNAPSEQLSTLSDALEAEAERRGLTIVPDDDPSPTYTVQGYLSTVTGASGTILIYVYDVNDLSGVRVHRISGQETSSATAADPWGGIGDSTLQLAAQRVIDELYAWLRRN